MASTWARATRPPRPRVHHPQYSHFTSATSPSQGGDADADTRSTAGSTTISGAVPARPGASVVLTGPVHENAAVNSSGAYSFTGVANGSYTGGSPVPATIYSGQRRAKSRRRTVSNVISPDRDAVRRPYKISAR